MHPWLLCVLACLCVGLFLSATGQEPPAADPPLPRQDTSDEKRHGPGRHSSGPGSTDADIAAGQTTQPLPLWRQHFQRFMEVTREQSQLGTQQKAIQTRLGQPDALGRGAGRERLAARLHELDAREREIRKLKREILQDVARKAGEIQTNIEESRTQLLASEAAETQPRRLDGIRKDLADLQRFQRFLNMVRQDPERFVDFIPDLPEALPPPHASVNPPPQFHMQIRRIEEQIRFLREKLARLEMELDELKSFLDSEMPTPPDSHRPPVGREARRNAPPTTDEERPRMTQRRIPGPRRDLSDMPPVSEQPDAASAPSASPEPRLFPPSPDSPREPIP